MINRIAFLCVNPWERFQHTAVQGRAKDYYQQVCEDSFLQEEFSYCRQQAAPYGELKKPQKEELFESRCEKLQILYASSNQTEALDEIFEKADLVVVGIPYSKKECDKLFLQLLPWMDKILFLWSESLLEKEVMEQLKRDYRLPDQQFLEKEKLPSFLTEALNC